MLIRFNLLKECVAPFIAINAKQKTDELITLAGGVLDRLVNDKTVVGYQNGRRKAIPFYQIVSVHTAGKKIVCETETGVYRLKERIYELIELLPAELFIQVSSAEIVSIAQIKDFSLSKTGIYQVNLINGRQTYTSRRYTQKIRRALLK